MKNRVIKFRAWVIDEEKMVFPGQRNYFIRNDSRLFRIIKLSDKKGQSFLQLETESHIMQFTGLFDNLGKEIYEGDIIKSSWNHNVFVVKWDEDDGEWTFFPDCNSSKKYNGTIVIGNIYENPELLNGGIK